MKNFLQKNFTIIVLIIAVLSLLKGCGDSRELSNIKKQIKEIKDSTYKKSELDKRLELEGLRSETRMIQSTDRKVWDLNRQSKIDSLINNLENELKK